MATIDSKIPEGALAEKWTNYKAHQKLVNPANKRRLDIIVVGTGLAGASAAASLGALGFKVLNFCIQDSPRRAHSIAAQGGINAAKNYQNDGDSVYRLFYDTIKGGDYRAREANVYRLAEVSNAIIDQYYVQHFITSVQLHITTLNFAAQCRISTQKELLTGLAAGIECTGYLSTTE